MLQASEVRTRTLYLIRQSRAGQ